MFGFIHLKPFKHYTVTPMSDEKYASFLAERKRKLSSKKEKEKKKNSILLSVPPAISVIPGYTKYIIIGIISLLVYKSLKKG